jgi:hypothetical protein
MRDRQGLEMTAATAAAVQHYDRAVDALLHFRPAMLEEADAARRVDPACPMAAALGAYLRLLSTEPADGAEARRILGDYRKAARGPAGPREEAHVLAAEALAGGDMHAGGGVLRALTREHPRDVLALAVGHQVDFFTGDALSLRDRIAEALPAWPADDPHRSLVLGMLAFGLEEAGDYVRAEEVGREAVERDPADVWGIHAVAHSYEMRARVGDGLRYLDARRVAWGADTTLTVHTWWHHALFRLEAGDVEGVLRTHDERIHHAGSPGLALELLDGSALLWRLWLDGHDVSTRWRRLAAAWDAQVAEPAYAFNDLHAVMAWVGAGEEARAAALIAERERWLARPRPGCSNYAMTARIGLPACRAVLAFARGRHAEAVDLLYPIRHHLNEFGGSHAQRDVLQRTLLECAFRAGRRELAAALVAERLHVKPDSPWNWAQQARLSGVLGDPEGEARARERETALRRAAAG